MDLRKINNIISLFLELEEVDQKALLNLLMPTPKPRDSGSSAIKDILESIKNNPQPIVPSRPYSDIQPYIKKGNPYYPTITY